MVTNEELMFHIKAKEQEIALAQQELQSRMENISQNVPQNNTMKSTMFQKAFRLFNDLTKPKQRPQYRGQQPNNFGEARISEARIGEARINNVSDRTDLRPSTNEVRNDELDYFKKLLRKRDIEIRKQKHMLTKVTAPKIYVKTDFMGKNSTLKIKPQKKIKLQRKFKW